MSRVGYLMPPAVAAAVVTIGGTAVALSATSILAQVAVLAVTSFVAGQITKSAIPTVRPDLSARQAGIKGLIRSGSEPAKLIYGKTLVGSTLAYAATTGTDNKYLHLICIIAAHEIESIESVYFDDVLSTDSKFTIAQYNEWSITVAGTFSAIDNLTITIGSEDVTVLSVDDTAEVNATNLFDELEDQLGTLTNVDSVTRSGSVIFIYSTAGVAITVTTDATTTGFTLTEADLAPPTRSALRITAYSGTQTTADADAVSELSDWTESHILQGLAYAHIRLEFDRNVFQKVPTPRFLVKGAKVYDPRSGKTAWADNAALCVRDYLLSPDGLDVDNSQLPDAEWVAAANICSESVQETAAQNSARYTVNGIVDLSEKPGAVIEELGRAMAGSVAYSAGLFYPFPGAHITPSISLGVDDLRDSVQFAPRRTRNELFNAIKGMHVSRRDNYSATNFPEVTNVRYSAEDNNEVIYSEIELPYTTSPTTAQRLAKIFLEKNRKEKTLIFPAKMCGLNVRIMDMVTVTIPDLGLDSAVFQCIDWAFSKNGVDLVFIESDPDIYDWSISDATEYVTVNAPIVGNPGRLVLEAGGADTAGSGYRSVKVTNSTILKV